ncbi:MAG TPA: FAD-binding oxidoreductase, partial [Spirochaetia bacterium]|nr:FAD-binding oxidoreductase [Spirochaetia bacterium]
MGKSHATVEGSPAVKVDPRTVEQFLAVLRGKVSGDIRTDTYTRILYSTDASIYQVMPYGVLIPKSNEDVHAAVETAAKLKVPILPRTTGSSLAGQAVNEALVIDFTRHLDAILEVNKEEHWVRVQPGIVLDRLNLDLAEYGLQYGPDPASSNRAAIGGIVSNNSTGSHSIMYGMTADHVLEASGFLSDGSPFHFAPVDHSELARRSAASGLEGDIYRGISRIAADHAPTILAGTPHHWRRCGGYNLDRFIDGASYNYPRDERFNLAKLLCGAEGTLGVMTEIKLNLVPRPTKTTLAIVHFESLYEALSAVPIMLETGPSAVELLDNLGLTMCREVPQYARLLTTFVEGTPNCILITEFYGESEKELADKAARLKQHLASNKVRCTIAPAATKELQANVWTVRKVGLGLMMSIKGDHKPIPFIEDAAVPVEHLAEYVTRVEKFCNDIGTNVAYYAHASAGCIHIRPLINTKEAAEIDKLPAISSFAAELLGQYGGSLSSEHGAGRARSWLNEQFYGKELFALYREVKRICDPSNILNPGNMVDPGPMTENLRYGSSYHV